MKRYFNIKKLKEINNQKINVVVPEIKYDIIYHKSLEKYVLWKIVHKNKGYAYKGIFQGTRQECQDKLKEIKGL